ncbi:MAG: hypothetical protein AAFY39_07480, partial [Pseudomonadota bacterium]
MGKIDRIGRLVIAAALLILALATAAASFFAPLLAMIGPLPAPRAVLGAAGL